jgi:hypothetical protein
MERENQGVALYRTSVILNYNTNLPQILQSQS